METEMESEPPYQLIDIGANLSNHRFPAPELSAVVGRARAAGLVKVMVTGTSVEESRASLRLARLHPGFLYATAGVHPHDAKTFTEESLAQLEALAMEPECVALGECGLDFNRNFSPPDDQRRAFKAQLDLAVRLQKPLFIHERDAADEMVEMLRGVGDRLPPSVIHCFTGTAKQAQIYINMGLYIGLTGFLWKDRSDDGVQAALRDGIIPLERLLLETDAPFMYPNVFHKRLAQHTGSLSEHARGFLQRHCSFNRNEPCSLPATTELIAAFAKCSPCDVAFNSTLNALKLFPRLSD